MLIGGQIRMVDGNHFKVDAINFQMHEENVQVQIIPCYHSYLVELIEAPLIYTPTPPSGMRPVKVIIVPPAS